MSNGHALLSASSSHRWLNCTPSARLSEQFKENEASEYAKEGTLAHSVAERLLKGLKVTGDISPAMEYYVKQYVDFCRSTLAKYTDGKMLIEQRLELSKYVPKSFGTADCLILSKKEKRLDVIDLKYGRGVLVEAENNPQLMLYGLGCLEVAKANGIDVEVVSGTIFQPRLQNISNFILTRKELEAWGNEIMPTAIKSYFGYGETRSGDWCRFCPAKVRCRSYADKFKKLIMLNNKSYNALTDDELAQLLDSMVELSTYINAIKEELKQAILNGGNPKGYQLKEVSGPKILTPQAIEYLDMLGVKTTEEKQCSITKLKSVYGGKFIDDAIEGLTLQGPPRYQLVKTKDNLADVFKDIND